MSGSIRRRGTMGALLSAVLLTALIPGTAAAATRPIMFEPALGASCVIGIASDNAVLAFVWRNASGALKGQATVQADSSGSWWYCSPNDARIMKVGDRLKATAGSISHRLVIPNLTLHADRVNDVFRGKAPAGSAIRLFHYYGQTFHAFEHVANITAGADGRWSFAPDFGVTGGDYGVIRWRNSHGDKVWLPGQTAPLLNVTLGKSAFSGVTRPGASVQIELRNGATSALRAKGTAVGDDWGSFAGQFRNSQGNALALRAGDHLVAPSLAADADWIVPEIEGTANAATDVVSGRCSDAGTSAEDAFVFVYRTGIRRGYYFLHTEADGSFVIDFGELESFPGSDPANLKSGDRINVRCYQTTGDTVSMNFRVP